MQATPQGLSPLFCAGHYIPSLSHYIAFLDRLADLGVDLSEVGSRKQSKSICAGSKLTSLPVVACHAAACFDHPVLAYFSIASVTPVDLAF